ncbi:hypothetical protein ACT691_17840 [Vibrio metschnikovii]
MGAFAASLIALEVPVMIAVPIALLAGAALEVSEWHHHCQR